MNIKGDLKLMKCPECEKGELRHVMNEAHGISGTYMAGSERCS